MTHVYIIERCFDYEGCEFIDVCADDLELAKTIANRFWKNVDSENNDLEFALSEDGIYHAQDSYSYFYIHHREITSQ